VLGGKGGSVEQLPEITRTPSPTPTPFGQTPRPTPPPSPPDVAGQPTTFPDGLQFITISEGTSAQPVKDDVVTVNYTGWVQGGKLFDSSLNSGRTPFTFVIGRGNVIQGWDEGISMMKVGGKYRLVIPPDLAYLDIPNGSIPAGSTLIFDIDLISTANQTPSATPAPS
jgi:peptidylprolyl isomerase